MIHETHTSKNETHIRDDETQPPIHESHTSSPPWRVDSREYREKKKKEVREKERDERYSKKERGR